MGHGWGHTSDGAGICSEQWSALFSICFSGPAVSQTVGSSYCTVRHSISYPTPCAAPCHPLSLPFVFLLWQACFHVCSSKPSADVQECHCTSGLGSAKEGMSHYSLASSRAPLFRSVLCLIHSGPTVNDTWHCQPSTAGNHSPGVFQLCPVVLEWAAQHHLMKNLLFLQALFFRRSLSIWCQNSFQRRVVLKVRNNHRATALS